jgi:hypothetical protein
MAPIMFPMESPSVNQSRPCGPSVIQVTPVSDAVPEGW